MKNLIVVLASFLCVGANAQVMTNGQAVKVITPYQNHCAPVVLGTGITEMTGGNSVVISTNSAGIYVVDIANLSSSNDVYCSDDVSVSTFSTTHIGWLIKASSGQPNSKMWAIATWQKWYCTASSSSTTIEKCLSK